MQLHGLNGAKIPGEFVVLGSHGIGTVRQIGTIKLLCRAKMNNGVLWATVQTAWACYYWETIVLTRRDEG